MFAKTFKVIAASSLLLAGSAAVAQSAAPLSIANSSAARAAAPSEDASELRGRGGWVIGAIVLGLLIWGAIELFDDGDPSSP